MTGLLSWGQAGEYNAVDDRGVITALSLNRRGLTAAPVLAAGPGLDVLVGPFLGVLNAGDDTAIVARNAEDKTVGIDPGPGTGSRTDVLWLDLDPEHAEWEIIPLPQAQTVGRLGTSLGTVTMPAGANTAAQATFTRITALWPIRAFLTRGTNQLVPPGDAQVQLDQPAPGTVNDPWGLREGVILRIPIAGPYWASWSVNMLSGGGGSQQSHIRLNAGIIAHGCVQQTGWNIPIVSNGSRLIHCGAGDSLALWNFHNSAGNLNVAGSANTNLSIVFLD